MLYRFGTDLYSRTAVISMVLSQLGSSVEPAYIDDETLALYGFIAEDRVREPIKEELQRQKALYEVDWVSSAEQFTKEDRQKIEAWRWLVRSLPDIAPETLTIPPLPKISSRETYLTKQNLTKAQVETVKNYVTVDSGWLLFLQVWKDLQFTPLKKAVSNLLVAYTDMTINEVISSI